jgi:predicted O-methyltransferase YrrM
MSNRTIQVTDALYDYILATSSREEPALRALRHETARMPRAGMPISPEQGQFMALLMRLMGAKRTLEVGVFTGYSALAVARALPEDGRIEAFDVNEEWTSMARRHWDAAGVGHKIHLTLGPASAGLEALLARGEADRYDFAFIDADKANYDTYYELALKLVRPGGLIAIDNTLWGGSVADQADQDVDTVAIRALNAKIHRDERVDVSLLPVGDGLTLARRR